MQVVESMEPQGSRKSEGLAILDTGSAGSTAGREWIEDHIENLCPEDKKDVKRMEGGTYFKFGCGNRLQSQQRLVVPVYFAERRVLMAIDMVEARIPLLISLSAMKKTKTVIYMATDIANILGQDIKLVRSDGHYKLSLRKGGASIVTGESMEVQRVRESLDSDEEDLEILLVDVTADEITVPGITKEGLTTERKRDDEVEIQEEEKNMKYIASLVLLFCLECYFVISALLRLAA